MHNQEAIYETLIEKGVTYRVKSNEETSTRNPGINTWELTKTYLYEPDPFQFKNREAQPTFKHKLSRTERKKLIKQQKKERKYGRLHR